jgi:hypothetical protein
LLRFSVSRRGARLQWHMSIFVSAQSANRTARAQYWPEPSSHSGQRAPPDPRIVDPAEFIATLRAQYSLPPLPDLLLRARSAPANETWWPRWLLDEPRLRQHLGAHVRLTESARLYNARFVWVGVPYPGLVPTAQDVSDASDRTLTRCMVSLVTHGQPKDKRAYIWCVVNADGDAVELSEDILRALLATEIRECKAYVKRGGTMASTSGATDYVAAAQLMAMNVTGLPGVDSHKLLPFAAEQPSAAGQSDFLTPVPTTTLKNRSAVLDTMRRSIQKKRAAGEPIPNPLCPPGGASRDTVLAVMRYIIHYCQFDPAAKAALGPPPHADDMAAIMRDPAFVEAIRTCGDLFYQSPPQ